MLVINPQQTSTSNDSGIVSTVPLFQPTLVGTVHGATYNQCYTRGPTGKTLNVNCIVGSPYIAANIYDDITNTWTALTISGALVETAAQSDQSAFLSYSDSQGKYYFKTGGAKKIYPLTLVSTTLTIGTAIDVSAGFAGASNTVAMTTDRTDLYLLDTAGVLKKCTLPAGTLGSTLTAPSLTGFDVTSVTYWKLYYANGYLWLFGAATAATTSVVGKMQVYNISGNSWSSPALPQALVNQNTAYAGGGADAKVDFLQICIDPTVSTEWYFATFSNVYKYTVATGDCYPISPFGVTATQGFSPSSYGLGKNTGYLYYRMDSTNFTRGFSMVQSTNGASTIKYYSILTFLRVASFFKMTGSGYITAMQGYPGYYLAAVSENFTISYRIDGGAIQTMNLGGIYFQNLQNKKIYFSTSIEFFATILMNDVPTNFGQPLFLYKLN